MKNLYQIVNVCLFIWLVNFVVIFGWGSDNKIKLRDLEVLTLHENKYTSTRRGYSIPQLKCVGGGAGCKETPRTVQCKNAGWDGTEVQWECKAHMPSYLTFGRINVNCEGFDHPGDKYILQGSCGLEYTLENEKGKSNQYYNDYSTKSSRMANLVGIAIIALVIYGFYRSCLQQPQYSPTDDYSTPYPGSGSGSGPRPTAPPPPGFRSDYYQGTDSCSGNQRNSGSGAGGFWTGAATGGLLGYLFGSSGNSGTGYRQGYGNSFSGGFGSGGGWGSERRRSTSTTHTSTGYGGTTVR